MNKKIRKYGRLVFSFIFRYAFLTKIKSDNGKQFLNAKES